MNELSALRRLAMSSAKACAVLHRRAGCDSALLDLLADKQALVAAVSFAHRIAPRDVDRLSAPLVTSEDPAPEPTLADVEHVRFMHFHG